MRVGEGAKVVTLARASKEEDDSEESTSEEN